MRLWRRFLPRSLTAQITLIVAVSVILGVLLVVSSVLVFFNGGPRHNLSVTAARIADVSFMVQGARSHDEAAAIIIAARRTGLRVTLVALDDLETSPKPPELSLARKLVADQLEATWGVDVIEGARLRGDGVGYLAVRAGDYSALLFEMSAELSGLHPCCETRNQGQVAIDAAWGGRAAAPRGGKFASNSTGGR